ncbi:hypothetical protein BWQ96_04646 [Gracilariopsis chorda]|uniref:Uncharacterized protein n=1 Tax=Gracilariopsis chorda TaxID=448386 RepID=A0A2V3ITZ6_9FLOR|nr:hypothetical protein BWQ96_04646 [Gracilariopsis chorda]|eukprot:PXF45569.1 hypothetical protein BWQ96_04646 [Gracilariopsis chorda]
MEGEEVLEDLVEVEETDMDEVIDLICAQFDMRMKLCCNIYLQTMEQVKMDLVISRVNVHSITFLNDTDI